MQREGIFREMKLRGHYEKPSEKKTREKAEAIRRARKLGRKKMQPATVCSHHLAIVSRILSRSRVDRASRSSRVTISTSPSPMRLTSKASPVGSAGRMRYVR
jgi:DNA invertase Pin-like site-specific DNA recombinase